jgi:hypothetical protein
VVTDQTAAREGRAGFSGIYIFPTDSGGYVPGASCAMERSR